MVGPRYNFVQPGWKIIPYVEGGVGIGFADSNPPAGRPRPGLQLHASRSGRARSTRSTDDFFVRLASSTSTSPTPGFPSREFQNHPIDALGPKLFVRSISF